MFNAFIKKVFGTKHDRQMKRMQPLIDRINALEPKMKGLADADFPGLTADFRAQLAKGRPLDELTAEAFAAVREASVRALGMRHYDVQMIGGIGLHQGRIAEMRTGEGKTLTATSPLYLNALVGRGTHLITVNDYLAKRDAEWMGQIYRFLGMSVGVIVGGMYHTERQKNYRADITYGTNNEFGFDYLRDNMKETIEKYVQRDLYYAIVDEVDSILIDEARTPLIISGEANDSPDTYVTVNRVIPSLRRDLDFVVDEKAHSVQLTDAGVDRIEKLLACRNLYAQENNELLHHVNQALRAHVLYKKDVNYIVENGEVIIIDEFRGRKMEGRRWSDGLHQAVEAKEGVDIQPESRTLATITYQNYFRMYDKLAGMTGTAVTEAAEFETTYGLQVVPIPTHRDLLRQDQADLIYKSEDFKYEAVVEDIAERYETGQPVLVGTISVAKSEKLGRMLEKRGIPHEVLNAKQHTREAEIVTQAGRLHSVTVATNMAGRGVDILLGGNPEGLALRDVRAEGLDPESDEGKPRFEKLLADYKAETDAEGKKIREIGGLYVLGTERHDSRRIDNQLRGRSGRQGDPGESRFYLSLEDELMRLFATGAMNWVMGKALPDDIPIEAKMVTKAIERAQNTVEQRNAEIRKNVLKYDEVMNEQRKVIYKRRDQILEDADLRDETLEYLDEAVEATVGTFCVSEVDDEWDVEGLHVEITTYWPTAFTEDQLREAGSTDKLKELLLDEATAYYESREAELGAETMRQIERQVMLNIIDQHWREHLLEMDYLEEGINLRAMGQRDPLVEWQREGFQMFGVMMQSIAQDFVKYVMHVQVVVEDDKPANPVADVSYSAPDEPGTSGSSMAAAAKAQAAADGAPAAVEAEPEVVNAPVVKSDWDKTPRNAPCPCGSGKKFKQCHGS